MSLQVDGRRQNRGPAADVPDLEQRQPTFRPRILKRQRGIGFGAVMNRSNTVLNPIEFGEMEEVMLEAAGGTSQGTSSVLTTSSSDNTSLSNSSLSENNDPNDPSNNSS